MHSPSPATTTAATGGDGVWRLVLRDSGGRLGLVIVTVFTLLAIASWTGWVGQGWSEISGGQWGRMSATHWFGTNRLGQDIFDRALVSTGLAFSLGLTVALSATMLGALVGALAGWLQGRIADATVVWVVGVLDSIPFYLFAAALAFALKGNPWAMHAAMIATFWTATARLVRAEVIRLRQREFVLAARAMGLPAPAILLRHVLPNTAHILLVQATLTFVAAIKTEVILSFLGLGVQDGVSWGLMLAESTQDVLAGHLGNFLAASTLLFTLLLGFNLVADALQDVLGIREAAA